MAKAKAKATANKSTKSNKKVKIIGGLLALALVVGSLGGYTVYQQKKSIEASAVTVQLAFEYYGNSATVELRGCRVSLWGTNYIRYVGVNNSAFTFNMQVDGAFFNVNPYSRVDGSRKPYRDSFQAGFRSPTYKIKSFSAASLPSC